MIILTEVAEKLSKILNGLDEEVGALPSNPTPFYFKVETEGFHIDEIKSEEINGNFIPVFISSLGGQFNPVKGLKQGTYSLPIDFYYPVRFKDYFFALGEFLVEAFVGTILNYGPISGKAVSNISAPQYGEIQSVDFKQFVTWIDNNFKLPVDVMEQYMSMRIVLYLSNAAKGLIYGNDIQTNLSIKVSGQTYTLIDVDIDGASLQSNTQAQSEQEEGTNEAISTPFGTAYGASFKIYPNLETEAAETHQVASTGYEEGKTYYRKEDNSYIQVSGINSQETYDEAVSTYGTLYVLVHYLFYEELLKAWFQGKIQEVECGVSYRIRNTNLIFSRVCVIESVVAPIEKGQLFSLTLTFANKGETIVEE